MGSPSRIWPSTASFSVQGLLTTEAGVEQARGEIRQTGLYGNVSCDTYNGRDLPYVDNLINLLLCKDSCAVSRQELMRVIAPGGLLLVESAQRWEQTVKPFPSGMDEWNQFLHGSDNNGVSLDDVGPPQRLRWHDAPEFGRSKALSPSVTSMVSASGVVFAIEDRATTEDVNAPVGYYLVARDAFNGIQLWKRPMREWSKWQTNSIKSISTQQQRCLAAIGNRVYCCPEFGGPVTTFASRTGAEQQVFERTEKTTEFAIEGKVLYAIKGTPYKVQEESVPGGNVELYALDLGQGSVLWSKPIDTEYTGGTLAVMGSRLVYHSQSGLTCLDSTSGKLLWTESAEAEITSPKSRRRVSSTKKTTSDPSRFTYNEHPTVVLTDDMVFCGIGASIVAKNLQDGKTLWTAAGASNYMKSPDLFVADGLVWSRDLTGRDPKTGQVVRQLQQEVDGPMSHDRCYRNRITHRYYLNSASGGTDFLKLDGKAESPNPWVRSTCGLAVMPANGMVYNGPYVCQCAIGVMVTGLNGLYNGTGNSDERFTVTLEPRLVKGPAFGCRGGAAATPSDWPTYRCSSMRSAVTVAHRTGTRCPKMEGRYRLAPDRAGRGRQQRLCCPARRLHTACARPGKRNHLWSFTAGGRIDSPPTYYQGRGVIRQPLRLGLLPAGLGRPAGVEVQRHAPAAADLRHRPA